MPMSMRRISRSWNGKIPHTSQTQTVMQLWRTCAGAVSTPMYWRSAANVTPDAPQTDESNPDPGENTPEDSETPMVTQSADEDMLSTKTNLEITENAQKHRYSVVFTTHCSGLALRNSLGTFRHKQDSTLVAEQTTIFSDYIFLRVNI